MSGFCWKLKQRHQYTELETREPVEAGKHEEVAEDETDSRNLRYPFQIFFILSTEVCERFSYYGMNAILTFYLIFLFQKTMSEKEAEDLSTVIFHLFKFFCYATPVFGAALADSVFGKFRTIFYLSILYAIGQSILAFGAVSDSEYGIEGLPNLAISSIGIFLIAIGTGGIKPCVVALGADQFKVPEQKKQMATYFAMFYASINFGSLISTIATPYLRKVPCLGEESCYSLAFGVPAGLMAVALVIFALGKPMYTVNIPKRNVLVDSVKCIWCAIKNRRSKLKDGHWLDVAAPEFGDTFVQDLKAVFRVSAIFLMYPMYWALYDQQGSRWTIQASKMNGYTFGFQILPDQMQVANPVLILLLIPLFDVVIYPLLGKCNLLKTPLQRIVTGCFLVAVAFIVSGILELQLKTTFPDIPSVSQGRLTIHNGLNTPITWKGDSASKFGPSLESSGTFSKNIDIGSFNIEGVYNDKDFKKSITLISQQNLTIIFRPDFVESNDVFYSSKFGDVIDKTDDGMPRVRFYVETNSSCGDESTVVNISQDEIQSSISVNKTNPDSSTITLESIGEHTISLSCKEAEYFKGNAMFEIGGSYIVFVYDGTIHVHALTQPSTIHIFWILPQYIILTVGEILFSITCLEFAYSQAPVSMKSIMQSLFYLTTAVGNLITLIVVGIVSALELEQWIEFFLFAGLLVLFTFLLMLFTIKYKYVDGKEKREPEIEVKVVGMEGAPGTDGGSGYYLTPIMIRPTQNTREAEPRRGAENGLKDQTGLMNWNYSSAEFEDGLYEVVQGPEEGKGRGEGKVHDEQARAMGADDQKAYGSRVREWAKEQGSVNIKHGAKKEEIGGVVRRTNVQAGIKKSKHRYENVIDLPSVPMLGGSSNNGGQDECGEKEVGKNCAIGEAGSESLNSFSEA